MKTTTIAAASVLAALLATGCANTQEAPISDEDMAQLATPVCESTKQCAAMWQRAQLWVVNNGAYKIQTANDVVIQTYNPAKHSVRSAFTITKEPLGGERQQILMRAYCDNMFGCRPDDTRLRIWFNRYLRETPQ